MTAYSIVSLLVFISVCWTRGSANDTVRSELGGNQKLSSPLCSIRDGCLKTKHFPVYDEDNNHFTIENMTCSFFTQPLNHFVPRGRSPSYQQRYCTYDAFANDDDNASSPILFYTGNESPLEQYINHTGLMWELAPELKARVVFVEHRYEGQSLPNVTSDCLSYSSTIQALADYADILEKLINPGNKAPVIAFGGSYGGMLSGWMRMKYPHLVQGAIAASAPIGAFPQAAMRKIDSSARILTSGLKQSYPPDGKVPPQENSCPSNLLATWPLLSWLVEQQNQDGGSFLQKTLRLCDKPTEDAGPLLSWAQSIWFDLAEGSFPYPSSYIPFALLHKKVNLPAWPVQASCWNISKLHQNWGVQFSGDVADVRYQVKYGDSELVLNVDWDKVTVAENSSISDAASLEKSKDIAGLLTSLRDAVSIWYNITKDVQCYNVTQPAPNMKLPQAAAKQERRLSRPSGENEPAVTCQEVLKEIGSWEPLCCNDEINLVITAARGLGQDFFWPPSHPRGTKTYADMIVNVTAEPCPDPDGVFGYSKEPYEQWSTWMDAYYGGVRMDGHSNIVFSNGLLDPWTGGGVFVDDPVDDVPYKGPMVQKINGLSVIALIIEFGGHHTDLMYSNDSDPECVKKARMIEKEYIEYWIEAWRLSRI